jgi:hypothetical protein
VFRWPIELTALSRGSAGAPREAVLEVSPRGAAFTLAALSHVGHAAHQAVVDAYLKGQVRGGSAGIGEDSRIVAASLAAPLVAAYELGVERLTLADLILLPRDLAAARTADRAASGAPTRLADSARSLLRTGDAWHWIRAAEHFEQPGCVGTRQVGVGAAWHDVVAQLPDPPEMEQIARAGRWPAPLAAELREPSIAAQEPNSNVRSVLRALALAQFSGATDLVHAASDRLLGLLDDDAAGRLPASLADVRAGLETPAPAPARAAPSPQPPPPLRGRGGDLARELKGALTGITGGLEIGVTLVPGLDGYRTLCLLPPADTESASLVPAMCEAAWTVVELLIGRPLAERRAEPFALRLVGPERTTTLDVGESLVLVRNQMVFAAWVGSDGRVMVRLFPPEGGAPDG